VLHIGYFLNLDKKWYFCWQPKVAYNWKMSSCNDADSDVHWGI